MYNQASALLLYKYTAAKVPRTFNKPVGNFQINPPSFFEHGNDILANSDNSWRLLTTYAFIVDALGNLASAALMIGKNLFFGKLLTDKLSPCSKANVYQRFVFHKKCSRESKPEGEKNTYLDPQFVAKHNIARKISIHSASPNRNQPGSAIGDGSVGRPRISSGADHHDPALRSVKRSNRDSVVEEGGGISAKRHR